MKIKKEIAEKIYIILEDLGATSSMRESFIYLQSTDDLNEWRFQGLLGFGGKFWNEWSYFEEKPKWRVSCYTEDENPKRLALIEKTNKKLQELVDTL
jgi:hypothetical protein